MTLDEGTELEKLISAHVGAVLASDATAMHNSRCAVVDWVRRYATIKSEAAAADAIIAARLQMGPIANTSDGP